MQNRNQGSGLTGTQIAASVREEDLEELQALQKELRSRVDKSKTDGRLYMAGQYTMILANISAEVRRVNARFDRESLAGMRKEIKELKSQIRGDEEE